MVLHLDHAKQVEFSRYTQSLTQRMINTMWALLERQLYFANKQGTADLEIGVAVAAVAKTSRRAVLFNTKDGGCQKWLRELIAKGFKVCHDPKSQRAAEQHLTALGIVDFEREGYGCVAIAHINLRAAALFLEAYHPDFEWLETAFGTMFFWVKPFCDKVLKRPFNRKAPEGDCYEGEYLDQDLAEFAQRFPSQRFDFAKLSQGLGEMLQRFCRKARAIAETMESYFIYWDVDISNPPEWA